MGRNVQNDLFSIKLWLQLNKWKEFPKAKRDTCIKDVYLSQIQRKHIESFFKHKWVWKLYPHVKLGLSRLRRAAHGNKCFDHGIWPMFLRYNWNIWDFRIMGWKTPKTKELQNPVCGIMFYQRCFYWKVDKAEGSLPCNGFFWGPEEGP